MNVAAFPNSSVYDLLPYFQDMKNAVNESILVATTYCFYPGDFPFLSWERAVDLHLFDIWNVLPLVDLQLRAASSRLRKAHFSS